MVAMIQKDWNESRETGRPLINAAATAMLMLWGMSIGGGYAGSVGLQNQTAGHVLDIVTVWGQLIPIVISYSNPRLAARWMALNVVFSILLLGGIQAMAEDYFDASNWIESLEEPMHRVFLPWIVATGFSLFLWSAANMKPREKRVEEPEDDLILDPTCRTDRKFGGSDSTDVQTLAS